MVRFKRDNSERTRGELNRDSVRRRLSLAIDARRRLNAQRRGNAGNSASHVGPRDPRYEDPTRSHD